MVEEEPKEPIEGIPESLSTLIQYGVQNVFEAFRNDVKGYPGGIEALARDLGVAEQTLRAWWNLTHDRRLTLSNLVEILALSPMTNTLNVLNTVRDIFSAHRENEAKRKLKEIKDRMEKACE